MNLSEMDSSEILFLMLTNQLSSLTAIHSYKALAKRFDGIRNETKAQQRKKKTSFKTFSALYGLEA